MKTIINFNRINGKYISEHGKEITTEMLMNNNHEINEDYGWIEIELTKDDILEAICDNFMDNTDKN